MEQKILEDIAREHDTPAYLFDIDQLNNQVNMIKECLGSHYKVCYAMKANPFLVNSLMTKVDGFEVCSPGEYRICKQAGIGMEQIVLSGVYKEEREILKLLTENGDKGIYTIESFSQLCLLENCARSKKLVISILLRVSSGNQFGMDESCIKNIIEHRRYYPHLKIMGLQYYAGTQNKKLTKIYTELNHLDHFIQELENETQFKIQVLEYGPGLYVPYFVQMNSEEWNETDVLSYLKRTLDNLKFQESVIIEMGRIITATCGYFITTVVDLKRNFQNNYCIVDGGIHQLTYAGQTMGIKLPLLQHLKRLGNSGTNYRMEQNEKKQIEIWCICGSLCTVNDILVKHVELLNLEMGDILIFGRTGAYSVTEGMYLFLSHDLPKILLYSSEWGIKVCRENIQVNEINSAHYLTSLP